MIHIVMDSAGDIPPDWATEYDVHVIPVNIQFQEKTYLQGIDLSNEEFYRIADETGTIPKTSQPSPHQFVEFYERIAKLGETILSIHVTSKLSGTMASALMATNELKDKYNIFPFDSLCGSAAMGYMCKEARLMDRAGASIQAILERLDTIRRNMSIVLMLDTLDYARMSGRVKALQAALVSVLNVKPIVILEDGVLDVSEKVRTRQRALSRVLEVVKERVGEKLVNVAVVHARAPEIALSLIERVHQMFNCHEVITTDLSIGVAANLGPGTVGVIAYPVEEV